MKTSSPQLRPRDAMAPIHAFSDGDLMRYYDTMYAALGPQHWWPSSPSGGPFEIIVGAILTQSTAWTNVERAIANLRRERLLTPRAIEQVPFATLARLVRPSGYFRQKAKKLKAFVRFLRREFDGSLPRMFRTPTDRLRPMLFNVFGIGPETADSILLYAGKHPVFVADAYTHRVLERHGWIKSKASYEDMRALFASRLPRDVQLFNEYHALLVQVGKHWCRPHEPKCEACPLRQFLPEEKAKRENRNSKLATAIQTPATAQAFPTPNQLRVSSFEFPSK